MLTRRIFLQLTDSVLLSHLPKPQCLYWPRFHKTHASNPRLSNAIHPRYASSSTRWKTRQTNDKYTKEAKVQGLKSRAAFKLLEIDEKYKLFKPGQTIIDLGYAPGSWSQVAISRTAPNGRVIGIDILPVQPPKGVSTIQGNFLSPAVQAEVRAYVLDANRGRIRDRSPSSQNDEDSGSYIDMERHAHLSTEDDGGGVGVGVEVVGRKGKEGRRAGLVERDEQQGRVVDVVLSDMSAPWEQTTATWIKSVSDPYRRMMNTSGIGFKDHAGSMDLCLAALTFGFDTLRTGGHFVCKFYQGGEDKALEMRLKKMFEKVHREKPESSRSESKEGFFVALRRKEDPTREDVFN